MFEAIALFVASLFGSSQADGGATVAATQAAFETARNTAQKAPSSPAEKTMSPESDLQGPLSRAELESRNYPWIQDGVPAAKAKLAKDAATAAAAKGLAGVDVEVYFGSWCSDSHDHLPTFLALLDLAKEKGSAPKSLKLVALDRKKTYPGYVNGRNIEKLPTLVFFRGGTEVGRIIETPEVSIAADSAKIVGVR